MGLCFLCDAKLFGERTRVCSSITPHSNVPYPEKIVELLGDEFVVIVTPADHMCKKCTSLLTHMDKLENDLKLVKNAMLSYIQKKYGILPPDQAVKGVEIVNGHLKAEEQLEQGQRKVPSGLTVGVSPTVTTAAASSVQTPLKMLKTQQQQQQHQPQHHQQQSPQQDGANKMKIYKCGFCTFQSKELGHVRFHMRTHMNKKEPEKPILNQSAAKALTPVPQQKKRLYRCQVCSKSFDSRMNCLDHIQKDHNQPTASTSNGERETEDSRQVTTTTKAIKPEPSKTQENNQQAETPMDVDDNQSSHKQGTVDTDMMLNDNVPTEGSANTEQEEETENAGEEEETENSQDNKTVKEAKSLKKSESGQEEATGEEERDEEDTAVPEQEEPDQEIPDSVEKDVDEDSANVENKTGDLDIESMLAAIHNDNPTNSEDSENKV
uniref:C2H2-type domain-containing protein n=1 Tax=Schizaphis graminum TaxID=13262 RepID=A0A2S2NUC8_SCHGA